MKLASIAQSFNSSFSSFNNDLACPLSIMSCHIFLGPHIKSLFSPYSTRYLAYI